ncbi:dihydrofolate reductase family protein [Pseudoxanthomonas sp. z9]|uniref:dihydrofolate reductase family protein n=1 Tax=Pseudoxanthomonas sp. z9 TaxID=2584942 RepID=UPI00114142BF|nr:dihydrofolate reductase family protein [Pseudoxanthomonas sp. z9]
MKLVVTAFLSLDGVVQAPGGPDEDRSGGFRHGGWAAPYFDEAMLTLINGGMANLDALLLGRRTYEIFAAHWPHVGDEDPVAARFNRIPKYVATRTLDTLAWQGSERLEADVAADIRRLKRQHGAELQVHGSGGLVQTLLREDLIDELQLWWFPVVLGEGKRLFADGAVPASLRLQSHQAFDTGVIRQCYRMEGRPEYGYFGLEQPSTEELERQRKIAAGED